MRIPGSFIIEGLRNLFSKPATDKYPFEKIEPPDRYRGKIVFTLEKCIGCSMCAINCPTNAIKMIPTDETKGKKKPIFYYDYCIFCGVCKEVCPKKAIDYSKEYALASTSKDEMIIVEGDKKNVPDIPH